MLAMLALVATAAAQEDAPSPWASVPDASTLAFTARFDGVPFDGGFDAFSVTLDTGPDWPRDADLTVTVDLRSVDTKNVERDTTLAEAAWFDVAQHPQAVYRAQGFAPAEGGSWQAAGALTMKGRTRPLAIRFALAPAEAGRSLRLVGSFSMRGEAELDRTDFAVGEGEWADGALIGHAVSVRFDVLLRPRDD